MSEHDSTRKSKYTYLEPTFTCTSCNRLRNHDMREKGRNRCIICSNYKKNKNTAEPKSFEEYEANYLEFKRLQSIGMFSCSGCKQELDQSLNDRGKGMCRPCNLESKRISRMNKAQEKGKGFISRAMHCGHVRARHDYLINEHHVYEWRCYNKNPDAFMDLKQVRETVSTMTDQQLHDRYIKQGKPWKSPFVPDHRRWRMRYRMDVEFKLRINMRTHTKKDRDRRLLRKAIRGLTTDDRTRIKFGFSMIELKQHLESLFADGMSWSEMLKGNIHIDHVIPVELFDPSNKEQSLYCWSLANLQPLWARDNIVKSDYLIDGSRARDVPEECRLTVLFELYGLRFSA